MCAVLTLGELAWVLKGLARCNTGLTRDKKYQHLLVTFCLTVIGQVSGLQELGGEGAVGVLVRLLVARFPVLPVAAPKRSFFGGARRDPPPSAVDEQR